MRLGTILAVAIVLSTAGGCAGLGVLAVGTDETVIANPRLSADKGEGFLYSEKGKIYGTGGVTPTITAEQLRKAWGAPQASIERVHTAKSGDTTMGFSGTALSSWLSRHCQS